MEELLSQRLNAATGSCFGAEYAHWDVELRSATRPEFGHYQTNIALRLAKAVGAAPRDVAARLVAELDLDDLCDTPTVEGPGFINLRLTAAALANEANTQAGDGNLRVKQADNPMRVVVDYSSPNVAKQMHVGHLRSTVIGDAISRLLTAVGHEVIAQNHLGDWGTQFGMLIEQAAEEPETAIGLVELAALYKRARARFDTDANFANRSRLRVVALQQGDPGTLAAWEDMVEQSLTGFDAIYNRLGVQLTRNDIAGESSYNDALPTVVDDLVAAGLVTVDDGALCAFLPGYTNRDGEPLPLIVRKADGGFGYAATDLAAIRHRVTDLGADHIVYVVDARQALHFSQVWDLARSAGWIGENTAMNHVAFGTIVGADGKPFKTRSGDTVTLESLLDAAVDRAATILDEKNSRVAGPARQALAESIGIGAVKYADLSCDLVSDYRFDLDRMCAMVGNTGPYLQYAHARICSILAKAQLLGLTAGDIAPASTVEEEQLALSLIGYPAAVQSAAVQLAPHRLCTHLYDVAAKFSTMYATCPVLSGPTELTESRLALCNLTRRVLADGLDLLGIDAPTVM